MMMTFHDRRVLTTRYYGVAGALLVCLALTLSCAGCSTAWGAPALPEIKFGQETQAFSGAKSQALAELNNQYDAACRMPPSPARNKQVALLSKHIQSYYTTDLWPLLKVKLQIQALQALPTSKDLQDHLSALHNEYYWLGLGQPKLAAMYDHMWRLRSQPQGPGAVESMKQLSWQIALEGIVAQVRMGPGGPLAGNANSPLSKSEKDFIAKVRRLEKQPVPKTPQAYAGTYRALQQQMMLAMMSAKMGTGDNPGHLHCLVEIVDEYGQPVKGVYVSIDVYVQGPPTIFWSDSGNSHTGHDHLIRFQSTNGPFKLDEDGFNSIEIRGGKDGYSQIQFIYDPTIPNGGQQLAKDLTVNRQGRKILKLVIYKHGPITHLEEYTQTLRFYPDGHAVGIHWTVTKGKLVFSSVKIKNVNDPKDIAENCLYVIGKVSKPGVLAKVTGLGQFSDSGEQVPDVPAGTTVIMKTQQGGLVNIDQTGLDTWKQVQPHIILAPKTGYRKTIKIPAMNWARTLMSNHQGYARCPVLLFFKIGNVYGRIESNATYNWVTSDDDTALRFIVRWQPNGSRNLKNFHLHE